MNNRKRGNAEICFAFLQAIRKEPLRSTQIMCKANINAQILKELSLFLIEAGYVRRENGGKVNRIFQSYLYSLTQKGLLFLKSTEDFFMVVEQIRENRPRQMTKLELRRLEISQSQETTSDEII